MTIISHLQLNSKCLENISSTQLLTMVRSKCLWLERILPICWRRLTWRSWSVWRKIATCTNNLEEDISRATLWPVNFTSTNWQTWCWQFLYNIAKGRVAWICSYTTWTTRTGSRPVISSWRRSTISTMPALLKSKTKIWKSLSFKMPNPSLTSRGQ